MKLPSEKGTKKDLVLYRLETAETNLRSAKILLDAGDFKGGNNRAYYSIFHSISAVHAMDGNSYKRHKDAIANFNKEYIKTEIFPRTLGKKISRAELVRHASDYDDFYLAFKEETLKQIETAEELLMTIKEYCRLRNYGLE